MIRAVQAGNSTKRRLPNDVPRPAKGRSAGQWAFGGREPLNPNEQFKLDDDALNVRDRILNHYSKAGFDSIDKDDLRGRMRWMGRYTQRGTRSQNRTSCWARTCSPVSPTSAAGYPRSPRWPRHCAVTWVTGLRRVEAPTRANAPLVSFDEAFHLVKINPLATWTDDALHARIDENDILVNPFVYEGYPSIGCAPCTARVAEGENPRSGRWQRLPKTECGLHVS